MKTNRIYLIFFLIACFTVSGFSQEKLTGLEFIPGQSASKSKQAKPGSNHKISTVSLPFLDDFSAKTTLPSAALWEDGGVFINNDYPVFPPTYGVATFDALSDTGGFYEGAGAFPFIADHLSSVFINLASLAPSDSVYFSFYYQPQGNANDPETNDSLILQFLEEYRADTIINTSVTPPDTTFIDKWKSVWSSKGMPLDTFYRTNGNKWFKLVLLPLKDAWCFKNNFRFRFFNYASLASSNIPSWQGNCDEWNIDYVYLNSGRSVYDTLFNDITIVNQPGSLLKNYASMPFRQFAASPAAEMRDSTEVLISNLGSSSVPCSYQLSITDMSNTSVFAYPGGNWNLDPFYSSGYQNYAPHRWPKFPAFTFPVASNDSSSYTITHIINPTGSTQQWIKTNDTVRFTQKFLNYYAYDDGRQELGYGLSPSGSQIACRFKLNTTDTLKGLLIAFNRTLTDANLKNFYLAAWKDNGGEPGDLIWRNKSTKHPVFNDTSNFSYYAFDSEDPIILGSSTPFYVGVIQTTDDNLNLGYDVNNNSQDKLFYNVAGKWEPTSYAGSVMIRPVVGPNFGYYNKSVENPDHNIVIFPNPNTGTFSLKIDAGAGDFSGFRLRIFNAIGQLVEDLPFLNIYHLANLEKGIYFLEFAGPQPSLTFRGKMVHFK